MDTINKRVAFGPTRRSKCYPHALYPLLSAPFCCPAGNLAGKANSTLASDRVCGAKTYTLPTGTVTFLFTDIEGSTKLWEAQPDAMHIALERHDVLMRNAIETNGGTVFKTMGDAFCAAFSTAPEALEAALMAQQSLHKAKPGVGGDLSGPHGAAYGSG